MLGVRDIDASVAFYTDRLGLTPCGHFEDFAFFDAHGTMIALSAQLARARPSDGPIPVEIVLAVDGVRDAYERLAARGVTFLNEPHSIDGTNDVANFEDPDGNVFSLYGPAIREALATHDPTNTEWQRDLSVSLSRIGDVLVAQRDGPGALDAYRKSLAIAEALAERDPGNARAQVDEAMVCARLGTIRHGQDMTLRRQFLLRGRDILMKLKSAGKLMPNQDWIDWFDRKLDELR
jgi:catechol 2,3-dioxygenase-like lactoylglutathione lyase family enzyme